MDDVNKESDEDNESNHRLKGILKKTSEEESGNHSRNKSKKRLLKSDKSITWDEMNVIATLHPVGKDYGHMKIDEIPTPYERSTSYDGHGVNANVLGKRLEEARKQERRRPSYASLDSNSDDEDESPEERKRRESFRKKRRDHYNEYRNAKRRLSELEDSDDQEGVNGGK